MQLEDRETNLFASLSLAPSVDTQDPSLCPPQFHHPPLSWMSDYLGMRKKSRERYGLWLLGMLLVGDVCVLLGAPAI